MGIDNLTFLLSYKEKNRTKKIEEIFFWVICIRLTKKEA